jgi:hypothetical protein
MRPTRAFAYGGLLRRVESNLRKISSFRILFHEMSFAGNRAVVPRAAALDRSDEPVPAPWQRLDKARVVSRVVECLAKPFDGRVKAVFEVDEGIRGPELPVKLFPRNHFSRVFQEADQNLDRLSFKPDFAALLPEFGRAQVKLEDPKSDDTRAWQYWSHCVRPGDPEFNMG